ncbi:MAG: hypothetical protein IT536_18620 [Hyphomicrobiales bacterium]|nr:hypothetical protein [Hyphomicrobiales bacterium]
MTDKPKLDQERIDRHFHEGVRDKAAGARRSPPHFDGFITGIGNTDQQNADNRAYNKGYNNT